MYYYYYFFSTQIITTKQKKNKILNLKKPQKKENEMSNKKAIGENLCACVCTGVWSANNNFGKEKCLKSEMYKRNENKMEMHKQIKVKENWK